MTPPSLSLQLAPSSHQILVRQINLHGTYCHDVYDCVTGALRATARIAIEPCQDDITVRIELGDSVNTITLDQHADNASRIVALVESLANGVDLPIGFSEGSVHPLIDGLESMVRDAVRERRGTWYLPIEGFEGLALLIRQSRLDPTRVSFQFELNGVSLTPPLMLPRDRALAFELLNGCVQEFVACYCCSLKEAV